MFASSDIGWVVGHSFITYGPLIRGATSIVYEGKPNTGHSGVFWEIINKYKVKVFYTSPTAMRFLRKQDPSGAAFKKYDVTCLKHFGIVGERTDLHTYSWIRDILHPGCSYNDTWWQTETGHIMSGNFAKPQQLEPTPGCCIKPFPGWDIRIVDEDGYPCKTGTSGFIVSKLPCPPSFMSTLWENDKAFIEKYFSQYNGYYMTGDNGYFDKKNGFLHIVGRIDDVINTAGHRLSTSQIEECCLGHKALVNAAVIGAYDNLKGEVPVGIVVLKVGLKYDTEKLKKELIQKVRTEIGPVAAFQNVLLVSSLPRTISGKTLRGVMKKMINGEDFKLPPTCANPEVIPEVLEVMKKNGFGVKKTITFDPKL